MAVRTPHDALLDLALQALERDLAIDELRDIRALGTHMIEVEQHRICLTAIGASRPSQDLGDVASVALPIRSSAGACSATIGRAAPVAARTHDLAQRDLLVEPRRRGSQMGELGKPHPLLGEVIELEHDRVALAAVGARVVQQVREQMTFRPDPPRNAGCAGLGTVEVPAIAEVLAAAAAAAVLAAPEGAQRQSEPAPAAPSQASERRHRKPATGQGLCAHPLQ